MKRQPIEILDCTIRDGGYLNNWNFDKKLVREIYRNISKTGVNLIELGYRKRKDAKASGLWADVSEDLLNDTLKGISGVPIALMIDYGKSDTGDIIPAKKSMVRMYRVACNKESVKGALGLCDELKKKGYCVSLQFMAVIDCSGGELQELIKPISRSALDYVYFADSYGSLFPQAIKDYIRIFKQTGKKIGFHAHNSLQLAFANTLEAFHNGIDIVDATVFGMGRGAGNLPLETLIAYFEKTLKDRKYNAMPILQLIDRYFVQLQREYQWGYSLPYMLSGILEVHPNYAKSMVDYREYEINDIVRVLEEVRGWATVGFKEEILKKILQTGFVSFSKGEEERPYDPGEVQAIRRSHAITYSGRHKGRDFLILANGPSLKEYKQEIERFIKHYNPVVMGANYLAGLPAPHYHGFSNKKRFMSYADQINRDSHILLSSTFEKSFIEEYLKKDFEWISHLNRTSSHFDIVDGVITSDCRTISTLLAGVAIIMGAKRIFIAGMDGYVGNGKAVSDNLHFYSEKEEVEDIRLLKEKHFGNELMLKNINSFLIERGKEGVHILTPTSHAQFYSSIHNWLK